MFPGSGRDFCLRVGYLHVKKFVQLRQLHKSNVCISFLFIFFPPRHRGTEQHREREAILWLWAYLRIDFSISFLKS